MNTPSPRVAIALVHYPICDSQKEVVATNITNFDIHDIARAATVFAIEKYFMIHPVVEQRMFVDRVLDHWRVGVGSKFNRMRRTALNPVRTAVNIEDALKQWGEKDPLVISTHAREVSGCKTWSFRELRTLIHTGDRPVFILFGTGFGLTDDFMRSHGNVLESIKGVGEQDYRHLSVRSAVSIILDRLLGAW
ncbi:MAG: RNA methyltransferase [Bdellovibrionales bacterium]